jgi:hypothetical protein
MLTEEIDPELMLKMQSGLTHVLKVPSPRDCNVTEIPAARSNHISRLSRKPPLLARERRTSESAKMKERQTRAHRLTNIFVQERPRPQR